MKSVTGMLYLFRVISDEEKEFFRDILISGSDSFLDFHRILQENLGYDPNQLASFFITTKDWEKVREITLIDMQMDSESQPDIMENTLVEDLIDEEHQRLLYVFDFFAERAFFIELMETFEKDSNKLTPLVIAEQGKPPAQLIFLASSDSDGHVDEFDFIDPNDDNDEFIDDFPDTDNLEDF